MTNQEVAEMDRKEELVKGRSKKQCNGDVSSEEIADGISKIQLDSGQKPSNHLSVSVDKMIKCKDKVEQLAGELKELNIAAGENQTLNQKNHKAKSGEIWQNKKVPKEKPSSRTPTENECNQTEWGDDKETFEKLVKPLSEDKELRDERDEMKERIAKGGSLEERMAKRGPPGTISAYANSCNQQVVMTQREPPQGFGWGTPLRITAEKADMYGLPRSQPTIMPSLDGPNIQSVTGTEFAAPYPLQQRLYQPPMMSAYQAPQQVPSARAKRNFDEDEMVAVKGRKTSNQDYLYGYDTASALHTNGGTMMANDMGTDVVSMNSGELSDLCQVLGVNSSEDVTVPAMNMPPQTQTAIPAVPVSVAPYQQGAPVAQTQAYRQQPAMNKVAMHDDINRLQYTATRDRHLQHGDYQDRKFSVSSPESSGYGSPGSPQDERVTSPAGQTTDTSDYGGSPDHQVQYGNILNTAVQLEKEQNIQQNLSRKGSACSVPSPAYAPQYTSPPPPYIEPYSPPEQEADFLFDAAAEILEKDGFNINELCDGPGRFPAGPAKDVYAQTTPAMAQMNLRDNQNMAGLPNLGYTQAGSTSEKQNQLPVAYSTALQYPPQVTNSQLGNHGNQPWPAVQQSNMAGLVQQAPAIAPQACTIAQQYVAVSQPAAATTIARPVAGGVPGLTIPSTAAAMINSQPGPVNVVHQTTQHMSEFCNQPAMKKTNQQVHANKAQFMPNISVQDQYQHMVLNGNQVPIVATSNSQVFKPQGPKVAQTAGQGQPVHMVQQTLPVTSCNVQAGSNIPQQVPHVAAAAGVQIVPQMPPLGQQQQQTTMAQQQVPISTTTATPVILKTYDMTSRTLAHVNALYPDFQQDPTTCGGKFLPIRIKPDPNSLQSSGPSSRDSSLSSGGPFYDEVIFPETSSEVEKQAFWHRVVSEWPQNKLTEIDADKDTCFHIIAGEETRNPYLLQACLSRAQREGILPDYINKTNNQHETALYIAAVMNRPEMVTFLLSFGADPNITVQRNNSLGRDCYEYESKTALHYVAAQGDDYRDTLKALLSFKKIDKNARNSQGRTPLQCAALAHGKIKKRDGQTYQVDSTELIKELVMRGADLNQPDGLSGKTAIHYIIETKCYELVQATLAVYTGDTAKVLNKKTNDGNMSLHIAAGLLWDDVQMHLKLLRLLMNKGANPSAPNQQNQLPRQIVPLQHKGHQEIINVLTGKQKRS